MTTDIELDRIWPLGQQLIVPDGGTIMVAGAYQGRYMLYLSERFPTARLHGFEPQRFYKHTAPVHEYGLATANRTMFLSQYGTDGATVAGIGPHEHRYQVRMRDVVEVIHELNAVVDLALFNMEGSEWAILPYLLNEMMHNRIVSMAIQFHPQYVSKERAVRVLTYMDEYYARSYWDYPDWTYWMRK